MFIMKIKSRIIKISFIDNVLKPKRNDQNFSCKWKSIKKNSIFVCVKTNLSIF